MQLPRASSLNQAHGQDSTNNVMSWVLLGKPKGMETQRLQTTTHFSLERFRIILFNHIK